MSTLYVLGFGPQGFGFINDPPFTANELEGWRVRVVKERVARCHAHSRQASRRTLVLALRVVVALFDGAEWRGLIRDPVVDELAQQCDAMARVDARVARRRRQVDFARARSAELVEERAVGIDHEAVEELCHRVAIDCNLVDLRCGNGRLIVESQQVQRASERVRSGTNGAHVHDAGVVILAVVESGHIHTGARVSERVSERRRRSSVGVLVGVLASIVREHDAGDVLGLSEEAHERRWRDLGLIADGRGLDSTLIHSREPCEHVDRESTRA